MRLSSLNGVRRLALLAAFWILGTATVSGAAAQADTAAIVGVLRSAGDGAPLPLSLVELLSTDSAGAALRSVLTDDAGRFRFGRIPAGIYRLRVARVGYATLWSAPLQLRSGETLQQHLSNSAVPIQLAELRVGPSRCLRGSQLAEVPQVATLWNEARKGSEVRNAFMTQYSFVWIRAQTMQYRNVLGRRRSATSMDTIPSEQALRRDAQRQRRLAKGYGRRQGPVLNPVSEVDVLNHKFLETHCVEAVLEEGDGVLGLHFRPVHLVSGSADIRGVIWVESDGFLIRGFDYEWIDAAGPIAGYTHTYEDVPVGDRAIRLLTGGELSGRGELYLRLSYSSRFERIRRVVP